MLRRGSVQALYVSGESPGRVVQSGGEFVAAGWELSFSIIWSLCGFFLGGSTPLSLQWLSDASLKLLYTESELVWQGLYTLVHGSPMWYFWVPLTPFQVANQLFLKMSVARWGFCPAGLLMGLGRWDWMCRLKHSFSWAATTVLLFSVTGLSWCF